MNRYILNLALVANTLCILNASDVVTEIKSDADFEKIVLKAERSVVVDFYAEWCGPCKQMKQRFEDVAKQLKTFTFVKVNVDTCKETAKRYKIQNIPAFAVFKNGKLQGQFIGACSTQDCIKNITEIVKRDKAQDEQETMPQISDDMQMLIAIGSDNCAQIKDLINKGFDINQKIEFPMGIGKYKGKMQEMTPLLFAFFGKKETVKALLDAGASLTMKVKYADGNEYTVLESIKKQMEDQIVHLEDMIKFVTEYKE
jgi:thioredoxin 1